LGYFSNSDEGLAYEAKWCSRCVHNVEDDDDDCPILQVHFFHQGTDVQSILDDFLIPTGNKECYMFVDKKKLRKKYRS
jgi:hypothetical protein